MPGAGFDFDLGAVVAADGTSALGGFAGAGANLDTGVELVIDEDLKFEDEVGVGCFGGEEGVGAAYGGGAGDDAVFENIGGLTIFNDEIVEVGKEGVEAGLLITAGCD